TTHGRLFGRFGEDAERGDLGRTLRTQLIRRQGFQLSEVLDQRRLQSNRHLDGIAMRASQGLLDHLIQQGEPVQPLGRDVGRVRPAAVLFGASAAASFLSWLFHRIDAQPSGEMTEYVLYWSISSRSQT